MFNPMAVSVGSNCGGVDSGVQQNQSPGTLERNSSRHYRDVSLIPGKPLGEQFAEMPNLVQNAFLERYQAELSIWKIRQEESRRRIAERELEDNRNNLIDYTTEVDFKETLQPERIALSSPTEKVITNTADIGGFYAKVPSPSSKKYRPLPKYRAGEVPEFHKTNQFDWTNKNPGAEESFNNMYVIKLANGQLPPTPEDLEEQERIRNWVPVSELLKRFEDKDGVLRYKYRHGRQITDAASNSTDAPSGLVNDKNKNDDQRAINAASSGLVTRPSPSPEGFPPMVVPSDLPGGSTNFLEDHRLFCVLCGTNQHSTINCQEPPPAKISRIRNLNLCKKCLDPSHNVKNCPHDFITCVECGMQHLDYIFHKPANWTKKSSLPVNKNLLQKLASSPNFKRF